MATSLSRWILIGVKYFRTRRLLRQLTNRVQEKYEKTVGILISDQFRVTLMESNADTTDVRSMENGKNHGKLSLISYGVDAVYVLQYLKNKEHFSDNKNIKIGK